MNNLEQYSSEAIIIGVSVAYNCFYYVLIEEGQEKPFEYGTFSFNLSHTEEFFEIINKYNIKDINLAYLDVSRYNCGTKRMSRIANNDAALLLYCKNNNINVGKYDSNNVYEDFDVSYADLPVFIYENYDIGDSDKLLEQHEEQRHFGYAIAAALNG